MINVKKHQNWNATNQVMDMKWVVQERKLLWVYAPYMRREDNSSETKQKFGFLLLFLVQTMTQWFQQEVQSIFFSPLNIQTQLHRLLLVLYAWSPFSRIQISIYVKWDQRQLILTHRTRKLTLQHKHTQQETYFPPIIIQLRALQQPWLHIY